MDRGLSVEFLEKDLKQLLVTEKAYWLARHRQDAASARSWLARAEHESEPTSSYWRVRAAISQAEGDKQASAEAAQKAREALAPDEPAERYLLESLIVEE